jgi:rhodanese-related sulfurtransferase
MRRQTIEEMLERARRELERVDPAQARAVIERGGLLVDVRSERQREQDGAVPGAAFFPRNVLEWRADPSSSARDPCFSDLDRPVIVMCDEGYASSLAAATLQRLGFHRATDLIGGYQAWRAAGLPIERATD